MSRDVQATVEGVTARPTLSYTMVLLTIPNEHAYGIATGDTVTLTIKERS